MNSNEVWAKIIADRIRGVGFAVGGVLAAVMGTAATSIWGNTATGALYALACFAVAVALGATGVIMSASGKPWTPPTQVGQFSAAGLVWDGKKWVDPTKATVEPQT